jgi:hypothetical protein
MIDPGQEMFLNFILERVQEGKEEEAKELLSHYFKKLTEGNFTQNDIAEAIPKFLILLKPEKIQEVQEIMKQFAGNFGK